MNANEREWEMALGLVDAVWYPFGAAVLKTKSSTFIRRYYRVFPAPKHIAKPMSAA